MLSWLSQNIGTILVLLVLLIIVVAIIVNIVRKRKNGEGSCSCSGGCSGCPMSGACHEHTEKP